MRHYIHEVNVIIDGNHTKVVNIGSAGDFNPNIVKAEAIKIIKENYPSSKLASVILNHKEVSMEEYRNIMGSNPPWFKNTP